MWSRHRPGSLVSGPYRRRNRPAGSCKPVPVVGRRSSSLTPSEGTGPREDPHTLRALLSRRRSRPPSASARGRHRRPVGAAPAVPGVGPSDDPPARDAGEPAHGPPRARLDARTPTTRASSSRRPRAGTRTPASTRGPALRHHGARDAPRRAPGRMRDQLPGRADVRGRRRRADQSASWRSSSTRRQAIARPRRVADRSARGTSTARRMPVRLPERGADAQGRHQGTTAATGEFTTVTLDTAAYEALYQQAGRLHDHVQRVGGHRGGAAGDRPALLPVHRLRLPGLLPGRARLRPRLARREPGRREGVRRRDGPRLRVRGRRPGRGGRRSSSRRTRACSTRTRTSRGDRARSSPSRGYSSTRPARSARRRSSGGPATRLPVRPGPARRRERQAADRPARLRALFTNDFLP